MTLRQFSADRQNRLFPVASESAKTVKLDRRPGDVLPRSIFSRANRAFKFDRAHSARLLQYRLNRFVVHAWLANEVCWVAGRVRNRARQNEHASCQLTQHVLVAVGAFSLEFGELGVSRAKLLLQFVNFVTCGRLLLLQREGGVLHVDDAVVDRLLHFGELELVARGDGDFCKVNGAFEGRNCGRHGHYWHLVSRIVGGCWYRRPNYLSACLTHNFQREVAA